MVKTEMDKRVRCPCCDSLFEVNITEVYMSTGDIILNKLNSETSHNSRTIQSVLRCKDCNTPLITMREVTENKCNECSEEYINFA